MSENPNDVNVLLSPGDATWLDFVISIGTMVVFAYLLVNFIAHVWRYIRVKRDMRKAYKRAKASRLAAEKYSAKRSRNLPSASNEDSDVVLTMETDTSTLFERVSASPMIPVVQNPRVSNPHATVSNKVACPNCGDDGILENRINAHLDRCLARNSTNV
eukprot:CFRG2424T1